MTRVYKVLSRAQWDEASYADAYLGAPIDHADGYIHLSDAGQVEKTVALYFAERDDLMLVAFEAEALGEALKWEPSRGGALFPHLYAPLPLNRVVFAEPFSSRRMDELRALIAP